MEIESSVAGEAAVPLEGCAVLYRLAGSAAVITLNRPEVLNAINGPVHRGLLEALERAANDGAIRTVVIRGSGRAFSAGGDLRSTAAGENVGHPSALSRAIWNLPKPVVAAVHGYLAGLKAEAVADNKAADQQQVRGSWPHDHRWIQATLSAGLAASSQVHDRPRPSNARDLWMGRVEGVPFR